MSDINKYIDDDNNTPEPPKFDNSHIDISQLNPGQISQRVMILIGPGESGKTAALIRLSRYLISQDCRVSVNRGFVTGDVYKKNGDYFEEILYDKTQRVPERNELGSYLLLDVFYKNEPILQILESPGEDHYSIENKDKNKAGFQDYLNTIFNSEYPKIYTFFFEKNMLHDDNTKTKYDQRIYGILTEFFDPNRGDNIILLYNKIDECKNLIGIGGKINEPVALNDIRHHYPELKGGLQEIQKSHPKTNVLFAPYSSGTFTNDRWQEGRNQYPEKLWTFLKKIIVPDPKPIWPFVVAFLAFILVVVLIIWQVTK